MTAVVPVNESHQNLEPSAAPTSAQALAHHESGHAVVCFLLYGERVIKGLAMGTDPRAGLTTYSLMPVPISCRPPAGVPRRGTPAPVSVDGIVDAYGVTSYAGLAAEGLLLSAGDPRRARPTPPDLDTPNAELRGRIMRDRSELNRLAALVGAERSSGHFFVEYWEEAIRLLRTHWDAVESLGDLLVEHKSLNGDRVDQLLRAHCPL